MNGDWWWLMTGEWMVTDQLPDGDWFPSGRVNSCEVSPKVSIVVYPGANVQP